MVGVPTYLETVIASGLYCAIQSATKTKIIQVIELISLGYIVSCSKD
jgi:hypothetical protein